MAVFIGCQVVFELSTAVKFKEKQKLRKLVTENGGIVSFIVTKKSTHVVCDDPEKADTSYKCRMAMKYGIPVVSPKYLQRSKDTSVLQKTDDFIMVGKSKSETLREGKITASKYQKTDKKKAVKPFINVSGFKVWNETDKNCPEFTSDYQVAKFAVFQNQKKEKNKTVRSFVVIEVHVDDSFVPNSVPGLKYKYRVACHSGVLELIEKGEDGLIEYRFCATVDETLAIYSHLYNLQQQKGMEVVFNVLSRHIGSDKFKQMMSELGLENIDISKPVKDLVQHIWQEAQGELDDIISETVTNTEQVDKAEAILKQIKSALDNGDKSKVSKLMADFYGTIPHHLSKRDMSCSKMWLSRKQDLCQLIRDMLSVSEATDWSTTSSTQSKYKALRCVIEDLSRASPEFQQMENLVTHSVIGNTKPTIQNIFAVSRPVESVQYTQHLASTPLFHATKAENLVGILSRNTKPTIHNTFSVSRPVESVQYKHHLASTPLFHATKAENLVGILSRGLLLPRVVVDDHGGKRTDPGMLGAGIYFANAASTSIKYSHPSDTKGTRFILINEVALGKTVQMYEKDMTLTSAPEGYQSVHGVRSSDGRKSAFQDDEFVIYNTSQQRMKYLVEFTLQDDKVKDTADDLDVIEDVDLFLTDDIFGLEDISLNDVTNVTDPMSKVKAGLVSKSDAPVNLKAVHIRAKLLDLASEVVVLQEYENNSKTALEAKYVFPLGDLAAVCGFEAFINGKHIVGEVKEKEKAHKEYKKAISEGHGAYLMDQDEETPDIFTVSVGNLPPGASVLIKITYVAELQVEGELINFQLPGSVAPWKKQSLKEVTQHETETHEVKQGETSVQVAVDMPFDIRTIECPSHQIKVKRTLTKATVEMLENQSIADGFQLLIGLAEIHVPRMWVERKDGEPNHQACMLSFYPEFEACEVEDVNVVLLLDLSNSMKGDNLNNTKKIALLTLQHLPSSWNFNIVVFGTAFKELFPGCVKKTPANVKSASEFIRGLTATMGNTEVIRPMHTFYLLKPESTVQNVFLISDGHINNEEIMMKKAFENFQHTRIFTMGVGSTANRHLLRALSRVAAGAYEFFDPKAKSKWERKVKSHINKAAQPGLTSVHVDWEQHGADVSAPVQAPRQITALFSGSRQVIYGFVPNCTMATLHANIAGEGVSTLISTTDLSITTGKILHRLAAKAIINDWEDGVLSADKTDHEIVKMNTKDYIIELSKEYSIVTQFTSFVAIEKRDKDDEKAAIDAPSMSELIEKENVDQLAYMGFEETKKTDLDYTHDIEDLLVNIRLNFDSKEKQNEFLRQAFKLTEQITDEHVCSQNRVNLENAFFDWELSEQFDFETEFGFKPKRAVKPPITVCVLTLTGRPIYVEIDENCSIRDLKEQVHKEEGTPPDEQRLLFGGRQVDDTRTLKDCDIQNLDVVHLLVRLRAGGTGPEQPKAKQRTRTIMKKASSGLWQVPSMATAKAKQLQTSLDQETTMSFNRIVPDSSSKLDDPSAMMPKLASKFARRSAPVAEKITILSSDDESLSGSEDDLDMDVYNKVEEEIYDQGEFVCDLAGFDLDDELSVADALSTSMHSLSDEDSDMIAEEEGKKERVTFKEKLHAYCIEDDSDDFCEDSEDEDSDMISEEEGTKGRGKVALQTENEVDDREDEDSEEKDRFMMFGEDTKHKGKVTIEMEKDEEEEDADMCFGLFDDGTMSIPDEEICLAETIEADKSVMPEVERFKMEELCRKAPFSGQEKREKKKKKSVYFEPRALQQPPARKKVAEDLLDVQEVLARNVDQVLERGERLDSLVEKSEHLHEKSTAFFRASLEDDLNGSGRKTATDGKRSHTEQVGKGRIGTMMGAVPPPMLESTFSQMSEDKSIDEGALLFGRKPKSGVRHHCFSRPDSQRSVHMFGGMSRALSPQSASGQAFGSPVLMDMSLTEKSADRGEVLFGKTAAPFEYMLRDGAPQMAAREMAPPPPRSPVSYSHSTKQMAIVGFGFGQAFGQSQQFPLPPSGGPASFGFMSLDGTLERGASEVAQTAPPLVTPHAVAPQVHASTHFCFSEPVTQSQKFTPPPPPPLPSQRLSVEAPKPHLSRNLGMLQFQSFDVQAPSYPPIPHFLPPPGGPPPVPGAPPCPPKGQTLTFDGPPPPPKNKGPTIVSHGPPPLPRGPSSASDGPPPPPRGPPLTTCGQSSTPPQQLGKPQRLSRVHRSSGYSSTTMGISRQDTEEARLLTEFEKPSKASMVSWRKERSRSPGVSTDKRSASSRDTLLSSIKEGRTLKRTTKPNAEKKESLVKELKSALMMRRSKLVEEDVDTPLLNDYEELSVITIDSLERADKPFKTGSITAGSPVLSDYGIGIQVPYIVRGKLDHTKKEEILTMIQYSQSKDGFWEIQPGSQLEAFLSIDMSLVEEVLNRAGLRSLGLSVYTDVVRVVSSVIVMLTVLELYLPDAFPLDFNDPVIEEKVLSDFENALMAGSFEHMMMVQRAFEFRLMIDEKIPLACKMLELGASWTHFVARMMDLHRESQEKGPVLYLHGLEQSQRMGNPIRA